MSETSETNLLFRPLGSLTQQGGGTPNMGLSNALGPPPRIDTQTAQQFAEAQNAINAFSPSRGRVDPIWPTSNAVGTERFVDYRGWDTPDWNVGRDPGQPATDDPVGRALRPAPGTEYGSVLPYARDAQSGELRIALPSSLRDVAQGAYDLSQGPRTGNVTPEGTAALLATVDPLARPSPSTLLGHAAGGTQRALREAEALARLEGRAPTVLDRTIAATEGQQPGATPILNAITEEGTTGAPFGIREADRVSTRLPMPAPPRATKANPVPILPPDPHQTADFKIGIDAMREAPDTYQRNIDNLKTGNFPDLPIKRLRTPVSIAQAAIDHMVDNLSFLYETMKDRYGEDTVNKAKNWYDGAHRIANNLAQQTGYSPRQIAAVMANMSPQKDWYQNADLADRLIDIVKSGNQLSLTPEMNTWATDYLAAQRARADTPKKQDEVDGLEMALASLRRGHTLSEINNPDARALFVRAYDEAHHAKSYPIITPDGEFGDKMTNKDGSERQIGWGSMVEIKKALSALSSDSLPLISKSLGDNHKVRSFYNNIISPNSLHDDSTMDTHAINAAHLRPMGGSHPVVAFGLGLGGGGSSSIISGTKGGYGLYHEAYRKAAEKYGVLPRQMQSIAWEAVRGLFSPEQKRDPAIVEGVDAIWRQFRRGQITALEARQQILRHASGMDAPTWYKPPQAAPGGQGGQGVTISDDGTIMSGGGAIGRVRIEHGDGMTRIGDIQITPSMQNRGLGTAAIRQIQQDAAARGNAVVLTTDAMRGKAAQADQRRLYERLGFVPNRGPDAITSRIGDRTVREELVWRARKE